jgi:hypothetical protein
MELGHGAVVVIKTNKEDTNIVDELKRIYDATLNHHNSSDIINVQHRVFYQCNVTKDDNAKIKIIVDGAINLESENLFGGNSSYYASRNLPKICIQCDKPIDACTIVTLSACKPTIVIHIINKFKMQTTLVDEIEECLNVLVFLKKNPVQLPIKQVIITKTIELLRMPSAIKIVADNKILYEGNQIFEKFCYRDNLCANCQSFNFFWVE